MRSLLRTTSVVVLAACGDGYGESGPPAGGGGQVAIEGIAIGPNPLLGAVDCNAPAAEVTLSIENTRPAAVDYAIDVTNPSFIKLRDPGGQAVASLRGSLAPQAKTEVKVLAEAAAPGKLTTDLLLTLAGAVQRIPVEIAVRGASLVVNPSIVDFGQVREQVVSPPQSFELENTGTAPVTITTWESASPRGVEFALAGGTVIGPGSKATAQASLVTGTATTELDVEFVGKPSVPLCGGPPKLALRGQRVNQLVTVSPGTLDFGNGDCGVARTDKKVVTILNYSTTAAAAFVVTPSPATRFLVAPTTGSVPVSLDGITPSSGAIEVVHNGASSTPGAHNETFTIAVTGPESRTTPIALRTNVAGALIDYAPMSLSLTGNQQKTFRMTNRGNMAANVAFTSSSAAFQVDGTVYVSAAPLNTADVTVRLVATNPGTYQASITGRSSFGFPPGGPICNPLPAVSVSGTRP